LTTKNDKTSKRGGYRPGAGRKKKDRTAQDHFESAEAYLEAVVQGLTVPDAIRVQAAKSLLSYQVPKRRAKAKSPTPKKLHHATEVAIESENIADFEQKAAEIRRKHAERKNSQ